MNETLDRPPADNRRIRAALTRLARRERAVLLLQAVLAAIGAWCGAWAALTYAVNERYATNASGSVWIGVLVAAGIAAGGWHLQGWRAARDVRRQAQRVEELRPELRGALLTVLDRAARPIGSPALLQRSVARVEPVVAAILPTQAHPSANAWRTARYSALGVAVLCMAGFLLDVGPVDALRALSRAVVVEATAAVAPVAEGPRAVVGDLTLRYLYPTYTKLEPMEVPNSNGEVHAPPGTRVEVRARTAEVFSGAAIRVYDAPPEVIEMADGRSVSAAFSIAGAGIYRFEFTKEGAEPLPSPDYRIVPDPDLAPDVAIQTSQRSLHLVVDAPVPLLWTARDDFGVKRLEVEVQEGGQKRSFDLRTLLDVPREIRGAVPLTPAQLGLAPGDSATLRIAAWDNDEVAGSKAGYSALVQVDVVGPRGVLLRKQKYRRLMRDALVLVLADFVVEPSPVVTAGADAGAWVQTADGRYAEFDRLVQEAWGGEESDTFDATLMHTIAEDRRKLFSFARSLGAQPRIGDRDLATLGSLQEEHVTTLENGILMLDQVLRQQAMAALSDLAQQVADEAQELEQDFGDLTPAAALARLDQLQRLFRQMQQEAAKLDEGALKEFFNDRASAASALMDEIRKAIAEGRMDDARELMKRLSAQMQQMVDDLNEMQSKRAGDQQKIDKAMEAMKGELAALEQEEAELRQKTEAAREKSGDSMDDAVKAWEEVEKLAQSVVKDVTAAEAGLRPISETDYGVRSAVDDSRAESDGLYDSARARDLATARDRTARSQDALAWLQRRLANPGRRTEVVGADIAGASSAVRDAGGALQRIADLLEKMESKQTATSPALQQELQSLAAQQREFSERAEAAAEHAAQLGESLPMDAPGLQEGTEAAAKQGKRAADAMQSGDAMGAEGATRAAEAGLQEAQRALEEAQRNMDQMQQAGSGKGGKDKDGKDAKDADGHDGRGSNGGEGDDMDLPAPESFQTPEEYRRALLEGMEGDVPEEYKALNRRYYEELVRQ